MGRRGNDSRVRPTPLPPHLAEAPFANIDAARAGVSPDRLRAKDLDKSIWGIRRAGKAETLQDRCALIAYRLRKDAVFSHATAALLLGGPLPLALEKSRAVHVAVFSPEPSPHARGLTGHSLELSATDLVHVGQLRATSAARTWQDMAGMLSLAELVALGDYFVHWRAPLTTVAALTATVAKMVGKRGAKKARAALALLDDRAESPPESHLRVILVTAGLPRPSVNYVLVDAETGRDVRLDLSYRELKFVIEYMGDYHRTKKQWRKDMTRRSRLEVDNWYFMELNADDLLDPDELVRRIETVRLRRMREFA